MLKYTALTMGLCAHMFAYANDSEQIHLPVMKVVEAVKQESQSSSSSATSLHKRSAAVDQIELETLSQAILNIKEKTETQSQQDNLYSISAIQKQLIINGLDPNELEGGYTLLFDSQGNLKNRDNVCPLRCILYGIQYGSPDAYLVLAITNQVRGASYLAFQYFLIAASGNNGVANSDNGGTSSELAFYAIHKILREGKMEGDDNKSIEHLLKNYSYKNYPYQAFNEETLKKQLQSLTQAIENFSRSKKQKPFLSGEGGLESNYSVVAKLSPRGKLSQYENE